MSNPPNWPPNQPPQNDPNQPPYQGQGGAYPPPGSYPQQPYPPQGYPPSQPYPPPAQGYPPSPSYPQQPYPQQEGNYPTSPYPPQGYPPSQPYAQGGYPPNYGGAPQLPPPQKSNSPVALIIGVLAAVVVVVLVGGLLVLGKNGAGPLAALGGTPTPIPTATATPLPTVPPAPAGFTTYTAKDGSYTIAYPTGWLTQDQQSGTVSASIFASGDQQDFFLTLYSSAPLKTSTYPTLASSFAEGASATNVKISTTPKPVTLGAYSWTEFTGTMTFQSKPYTIYTLGMDHGAGTFFLIYFAPTSTFKTTESTDFTVMAKTLAFKK